MASEMASTVQGAVMKDKEDEELARWNRRTALKTLNLKLAEVSSKSLDSSLKRHTALIKRMRQSLGTDNNEQIMKDISTLSLEKYLDELASAALEGIGRCKTERDVWSAVEIISALHRRFPKAFTPSINSLLNTALLPPQRTTVSQATATQSTGITPNSGPLAAGATASTAEQREKEDATRVMRQRPVLRVCAELALVGIIRDAPGKSGGEWMMKIMKDLLSNDPTLSSLPLLTTFLKSYARPYLGITPSAVSKAQIPEGIPTGSLAAEATQSADVFPQLGTSNEGEELVEKDTRARFKRMCEGYFESVSKKLVIEHKRLQDQDRKNHEAYIRSGEIFEDRQQSYEKMTRSYEKLLSNCQTLSELLNLSMPTLPSATQKKDAIIVGSGGQQTSQEEIFATGGKWEDEEERRFYEDIQDLRDFVPKSVLGLDEADAINAEKSQSDRLKDELLEKERKKREEDEAKELEKELKKLELDDGAKKETPENDRVREGVVEDESAVTPVFSPPKSPSPPQSPSLAPQGPSQLLTALLARLPDCTNRSLIDSAAVEFSFLNSKAARKRLVKFLTQVPKNRIDLLPHYSRLVATLNKYMPDVTAELIASLEEEFRYLQRKKNVVKELAEVRQKNVAFLSNLTKFGLVPTHVVLHVFKVCLDDFSGVNIDNLAMLLEGCGRYLLRSDETKDRFVTMVELMRRKQSLQHLDQRQILMLENAYYQCNPPERIPIREKERSPMELFIRHLICDVLSKKTIDKVLRLLRKLHWDDPDIVRILHNGFTKAWKIKYSNVSLLAMLAYDLQRYHPDFSIAVVDQVLENVRRGLETNAYKANQQRVATVKYLGELYIYRLISSSIIFDTLWSLVTFGHPEGRPLPGQACPIDMPDDFFRIRLVCVLLDTCGMCFDKGSQRKKLDNFLTFFQMYILTKEPLPMDVEFMLEDSLEAVRPKMTRHKTFEEAARAVDEIFTHVLQNNVIEAEADESGEESDEEHEGNDRAESEDEEEEEGTVSDSMTNERPPSPDTLVLLNTSDNLGPTEEDENEFAKELAKMVTESSAESRKVDKRTAQALWDSAVIPSGLWKKKFEDSDEDEDASDAADSESPGTMKFVLLTKKGNKQQTKRIAIPTDTVLAAQTRNAQLQDKVEQQQLKQLVLNYEQREEVEELKALESRTRNGAIKIRYVG